MSGGRAFCDLAIPKGTVGPYPAPRIDMRGGTWTIGALSAGALLMAALAAPAARSQTAALEDFSGAWRLDGTRQVQRMDDAIDRVVDQMNLLIREIARGEIHRRIDPEHRVVIRVDDEQHVRLGYDDWGPQRLRLGGAAVATRGPDGNDIHMSLRFERGRLIARQNAGEGRRTNIFSLSADGSRLTMSSRIGAPQLPADIRYRLSYRRAR